MSVIGLPEPNVTLPMESINGTYDVLLGGTFDAYLDGDGYSNVLGMIKPYARMRLSHQHVNIDAQQVVSLLWFIWRL